VRLDGVRFLGSRLGRHLGWHGLLVGSRALDDRGEDLRRQGSPNPLSLCDPAVHISEIVAHQTPLALPDLDERDPELSGAAIAAQHVERDTQSPSRHMLRNRHRNWLGIATKWLSRSR
jgi:hypothetical protein